MKRLSWQVLTLLLAALPGFAGTINYVCDPNASSLGSASTTGSECNTLTTTVAGQYATYFTNANATIFVTAANIGDVADNVQIYSSVNYSSYYTNLAASESGANDATAVNSLGGCTGSCNNPVTGTATVNLTGPLEAALGLGTPSGICFLTAGGCDNNVGSTTYGSCTIGVSDPNCYNDIITVGNLVSLSPDGSQYDFVTAVEHETDEALGTSSCLDTNPKTGAAQDSCNGNSVSAADLFRYSASGTRSFLGPGDDQAKGSLAYFSIDSGVTNLVDYNNTNNGEDYGDFSDSTPCGEYVQDSEGCPGKTGVNIGNDGGVEIEMLDAVGYTLATPEPSSIVMALAGLGFIGAITRRRAQARG